MGSRFGPLGLSQGIRILLERNQGVGNIPERRQHGLLVLADGGFVIGLILALTRKQGSTVEQGLRHGSGNPPDHSLG